MKYKLSRAVTILAISAGFLLSPINVIPAYAAACGAPTTGLGGTLPAGSTSHTITVDLSGGYDPAEEYMLEVEDCLGYYQAATPKFFIDQEITNACNSDGCVSVSGGIVTWDITNPDALETNACVGSTDTFHVDLYWQHKIKQCDVGEYDVASENLPGPGCTLEIFQNQSVGTCYQNSTMNGCFQNNENITVKVSDLTTMSGDPWNENVGLSIIQEGAGSEANSLTYPATNGVATINFTPSVASYPTKLRVKVEERLAWVVDHREFEGCEFSVDISQGCSAQQCLPETTIGNSPESLGPDTFKLCNQIIDPDQKQQCLECAGGDEGQEGIWTAIGCIKRQPEEIAAKLIRLGLSMGGGVALLMFIAAGFILTVSQGNPQKATQAKEMMTAAITGLLFIIFSVGILQFIGFSILKIPSFGGP